MAATYKVWIHVERCDEEKDTYNDLDVSFGAVKEFDSEDDAIEFANQLQDMGEAL